MATKTRSGVLLPVVVVTVAAVVFMPQVRDKAGELLGTVVGGTELVGGGATQFMVASSAANDLHKCTPAQVVTDRECDDLKFIMIDAARMPFIARNISTAWERGKPGVLTKDSTVEPKNRKYVCLRTFPKPYGGSCDEFPFASTRQGGKGAQEHEVPPRENSCQGGTMSKQYARVNISDGDDFLVVITNPDLIAQAPYAGVDIAKDRACP